MLRDSQNFIAFSNSVEQRIQQLTDKAMNPRTSTDESIALRFRVQQLKDTLRFACGELEELP